jgi:hypothetical protein
VQAVEAGELGEIQGANSRRARVVGTWLLLAAVLASLAVIPYTYSIERRPASREQSTTDLITEFAENVLVETLIGLGMAVVLAIVDHFVEPMMPKLRRPLPTPPAWTGLLASVGAGIQEEIWLRLGFMTFLVWLGTRIVRRPTPASGIVWIGNVLAAILFGALHLPQAFVLVGINATLVAFTLLGNGVPGIVFGWLYWRHGLVPAMVSHFAADLLQKGVLPLLGLA